MFFYNLVLPRDRNRGERGLRSAVGRSISAAISKCASGGKRGRGEGGRKWRGEAKSPPPWKGHFITLRMSPLRGTETTDRRSQVAWMQRLPQNISTFEIAINTPVRLREARAEGGEPSKSRAEKGEREGGHSRRGDHFFFILRLRLAVAAVAATHVARLMASLSLRRGCVCLFRFSFLPRIDLLKGGKMGWG